MRAILLIRPDIFQSLGLQNQNTKIRDNSVLLDWRTTYKDHRSSSFFEITDRILAVQQTDRMPFGSAWDHYFPFDSKNVREKFNNPSSFIFFMRLSLYRPRDIITMLGILQENVALGGKTDRDSFSPKDIGLPEFRNKYSEYLLGEIKDHLLFYYSLQDYEEFLKFFEFLEGSVRFSYKKFLGAFNDFDKDIASRVRSKPPFMESANAFLQFLFTLNVISYLEESEDGHTFIHWCFRERSYSNISPKVKTYERYEIHYGLAPALNIGKRLKRRASGKIKMT